MSQGTLEFVEIPVAINAALEDLQRRKNQGDVLVTADEIRSIINDICLAAGVAREQLPSKVLFLYGHVGDFEPADDLAYRTHKGLAQKPTIRIETIITGLTPDPTPAPPA